MPNDGICINYNSTCFDAYLIGDLMCEKSKNLIAVNVHSNLSWKVWVRKWRLTSKIRTCEGPWQREKYIDAKKARLSAKKHCESILEFFDDNDITVKSCFGDDDDDATVTTAGTNESNESNGSEESTISNGSGTTGGDEDSNRAETADVANAPALLPRSTNDSSNNASAAMDADVSDSNLSSGSNGFGPTGDG